MPAGGVAEARWRLAVEVLGGMSVVFVGFRRRRDETHIVAVSRLAHGHAVTSYNDAAVHRARHAICLVGLGTGVCVCAVVIAELGACESRRSSHEE